jgi:hypothetical protein
MVLVCAMFLLPLGLAVWLYQSGWRPLQTGNHGELIDPPVQAAVLPLADLDGAPLAAGYLAAGRWTLLLSQAGDCGVGCRRSLLDTRQVHLALGKDGPRVRRLLLTDQHLPPALLAEHPGLTVAQRPALSPFPGDGSVWVVDPLGNAMLRFSSGFAAQGLLADLRRLLELSHIG